MNKNTYLRTGITSRRSSVHCTLVSSQENITMELPSNFRGLIWENEKEWEREESIDFDAKTVFQIATE